MPREERAPEADKIKASTKGQHVLVVAGRAAAPPSWLKPLDAYDRRERGENQVTRFG
jgi:hypothetical protein